MEKQTESSVKGVLAQPLAHPLDDIYARAGRVLPWMELMEAEQLPEPYKGLLVHRQDMTPRLEAFYEEGLHLRVMKRELRDSFYFREVTLVLDRRERPVEFGAIKINLALFPPAARQVILVERLPLGHILAEHGIAHSSRPKAYLRVRADEEMGEALGLAGGELLYGRRNTLLDPVRRPLAEIVEILTPAGLVLG